MFTMIVSDEKLHFYRLCGTSMYSKVLGVYRKLILIGKGGGRGEEMNQREGERGNSSQSWGGNTNMIDCISSL
jgi:hypothetical protein